MSIGQKIVVAGGALAAAALVAGAASAQGYGGMTSQMYVKGMGGFTFPQNEDFDLNGRGGEGSINSGLDYDQGYALGVAIGYDMNPNLALEGEYMYRNAEGRLTNTDSGKEKTESNAWMVNALYKFNGLGATGQFKPFAGAGIGIADLDVGTEVGDLNGDYQFAYQLIAGVGYEVTPQWTLTGEARYFGVNDQTYENDVIDFKAPYHTFDILFGAAYRF